MIEIDITTDMVENAIDRANDIGHLNNSITSGQGNLAASTSAPAPLASASA